MISLVKEPCILWTRLPFWKQLREQVDKIIDQLDLSKSIPDEGFNFMNCRKFVKRMW